MSKEELNVERKVLTKERKKINFYSKDKESLLALIYDCFFLIIILICFSTIVAHYEIIDEKTISYHNSVIQWFYDNDVIFFSIFIFDFIARFIVVIINSIYSKEKNSLLRILKFPFTPEGIVEIMSIIPFFCFLPIWNSLRLFKFFTLTNLILRLKRIKYIGEVINGFSFLLFSIKLQSKMITTLTIMFILSVSFLSVVVYNIALINKDAFGGEEEINTFFDAFWFTFITMTTIGYGDIYPVTYAGRVLVVVISITGIIFVAIYTSFIINGLQLGFKKKAELDKNNKIIREENRKIAKIESKKKRDFIRSLFTREENVKIIKKEKINLEKKEIQSETKIEKAKLKINKIEEDEISKANIIVDEKTIVDENEVNKDEVEE